jgi:hypothetical protein
MPEYIVYIGSMFISFVLIIMMVVMFQQFNLNTLVFAFISSVFILLVSVGVMMVPVLNIATLSLLVTVGFYLVDVFWHHRLEGTYDSDTMSQYIIFAIMVIILLLYL